MLKPEIEWSGYEFELENREALKLEWEESYSVQYDFRKAAFEYSINKIYEAFDLVDENLIKSFINCLNNRDKVAFWKFRLQSNGICVS